jgi:hypothetical protein
VLPLLELERAAEVLAAEEALTACSPEAAQARGRALLNLRVSETEGGLLGRTLITLVNNKVRACEWVGGWVDEWGGQNVSCTPSEGLCNGGFGRRWHGTSGRNKQEKTF